MSILITRWNFFVWIFICWNWGQTKSESFVKHLNYQMKFNILIAVSFRRRKLQENRKYCKFSYDKTVIKFCFSLVASWLLLLLLFDNLKEFSSWNSKLEDGGHAFIRANSCNFSNKVKFDELGYWNSEGVDVNDHDQSIALSKCLILSFIFLAYSIDSKV